MREKGGEYDRRRKNMRANNKRRKKEEENMNGEKKIGEERNMRGEVERNRREGKGNIRGDLKRRDQRIKKEKEYEWIG